MRIILRNSFISDVSSLYKALNLNRLMILSIPKLKKCQRRRDQIFFVYLCRAAESVGSIVEK